MEVIFYLLLVKWLHCCFGGTTFWGHLLNPFMTGISQSMRIISIGHLLLYFLWSYKYLITASFPLFASTTSFYISIFKTYPKTSFIISILKNTSSTIIIRGPLFYFLKSISSFLFILILCKEFYAFIFSIYFKFLLLLKFLNITAYF